MKLRFWFPLLLTAFSIPPLAVASPLSGGMVSQTSHSNLPFRKFVVPESNQYLAGKIIVKIKGTPGSISNNDEAVRAFTSKPALLARLQKVGVLGIEQVFPDRGGRTDIDLADLSRLCVLDIATTMDPKLAAASFAADPDVEYATPVYLREIDFTPNDPLFAQELHLALIKSADAWNVTQGDSNVVVAIVDTGVDWLHPDLKANVWTNPEEIPDNNLDDDGNGFVDDVHGWDFADNNNNPINPNLGNSNHGTWVAGTAAAVTNNALFVAGVGFTCHYMPLKTQSDQSSGKSLDDLAIIQAIRYAADNGADVINMSFGGGGVSSAMSDAIAYAHSKGVVLVAAAGNDNSKLPSFPAADPNVLAVAATDNSDRKASFSNYGYWVDLAAPGVDVLTTSSPDTTVRVSGTSFSTPIVCGIAGLVRTLHPDWSNDEVAQQVRVTADDLTSTDPTYALQLGKGRADAFNAVTAVTPSIRLVDLRYEDADGDSIIEPGESVQVIATFQNYLQPAENVSVELRSTDPQVDVTSATASLGNLAQGESRTNADAPFTFQVASDTQTGHLLEFAVMISATNYEDHDGFTLIVLPVFGNQDVGDVIFTITSFGAVGFNDYANSGLELGDGFRFPRDNTDRALFHGGFLVATDTAHVSDVSYGNSTNSSMDFKTIKEFGELTFGLTHFSDQDGFAAFSDSVAQAPIGVNIEQRSYAWASPPNNTFVIMEYEVINTGTSPLSNVYTAMYLDWDIGKVSDNGVGFDAGTGVGYMYGPGSNLYGIAAVEPPNAAGFRAVSNRQYVYPSTSPPGFTDAEKFMLMTDGFAVTQSNVPDDWSDLLTIGPFDIPGASSVKVAYAVLGGTDLNSLKQSTVAARAIYTTVSVEDPGGSPTEPSDFALFQNHPNPFNPSTTIHYTVPAGAADKEVQIQVYNLLGQRVRTLVEAHHVAGDYTVLWDGKDDAQNDLPSGVYLYTLRAGSFFDSRKMLLIR